VCVLFVQCYDLVNKTQGTSKTEKLEISPCDHRDAVGEDDYNDDSEGDYDDIEKEEEREGY